MFMRNWIFLVQRDGDAVALLGRRRIPMSHVRDEVVGFVVLLVRGLLEVGWHEAGGFRLRVAALPAHGRQLARVLLRVLADLFIFIVDEVDVTAGT